MSRTEDPNGRILRYEYGAASTLNETGWQGVYKTWSRREPGGAG